MNDLQRFIERIGKRIYRDETNCHCESCEEVTKNWMIVFDEIHAKDLHSVSWDYHIEYRDFQ